MMEKQRISSGNGNVHVCFKQDIHMCVVNKIQFVFSKPVYLCVIIIILVWKNYKKKLKIIVYKIIKGIAQSAKISSQP